MALISIRDAKELNKAAIEDVMREVAEETLKRVRERTPVDSGEARDSWELDHVEGKGPRVSSKAHHIKALEFGGHSRQAPEGMLRVTVSEQEQIVGARARRYLASRKRRRRSR